MKKLLVLVWGLFLAFGLQAQTPDPSPTVSIYATVSPSCEAGSEIWTPFSQSVRDFWAGAAEASAINPTNFHAITSASWRYVFSSSFPLWLGESASGAQRGNAITCPFRITFVQPTIVSHIVISYETWDELGHRHRVLELQFLGFEEDTFGILSTGGTLTSGYLTNTPVKEVSSVGMSFFYRVESLADIDVLRACSVFQQVKGISCVVEAFNGETLLVMGQIDLPFNPEPARLQVNGSSIRVDGATNQQYRLQFKSMLAPSSWQTIGLPIFSGSNVGVDTTKTASMFRVFQGEP